MKATEKRQQVSLILAGDIKPRQPNCSGRLENNRIILGTGICHAYVFVIRSGGNKACLACLSCVGACLNSTVVAAVRAHRFDGRSQCLCLA